MAKKIKYYMGVTSYNTSYMFIPISKRTYTDFLKKYTKIVEENNKEYEDNSEFFISLEKRENEHEKSIEYISEIQDGSTYITLTKLECKDGYKFSK